LWYLTRSTSGPVPRGGSMSAAETKGLALYLTAFCPYCVRVRRALDQLGLDVALRDIADDPGAYRELVDATGRQTVPVLRIEESDGGVSWLAESEDIIQYFRERFRAG
jgi:glutaredoxin